MWKNENKCLDPAYWKILSIVFFFIRTTFLTKFRENSPITFWVNFWRTNQSTNRWRQTRYNILIEIITAGFQKTTRINWTVSITVMEALLLQISSLLLLLLPFYCEIKLLIKLARCRNRKHRSAVLVCCSCHIWKPHRRSTIIISIVSFYWVYPNSFEKYPKPA